jgi:hypothetical protein
LLLSWLLCLLSLNALPHLYAANLDRAGRIDPQADLMAPDAQDHDVHLIGDVEPLADATAQDQHRFSRSVARTCASEAPRLPKSARMPSPTRSSQASAPPPELVTVKVALAAVVLPLPGVAVTALTAMVFVKCPDWALVTVALTVQLPLAASWPPLKERLLPDAVSVPPQVVAAAGLDWMVSALGSVSVSAREESG